MGKKNGRFDGYDTTDIFTGKSTMQEADIDRKATLNKLRSFKSIVFQKQVMHHEKICLIRNNKMTKSR